VLQGGNLRTEWVVAWGDSKVALVRQCVKSINILTSPPPNPLAERIVKARRGRFSSSDSSARLTGQYWRLRLGLVAKGS
jgi:hypothetical protein